MAGELSVVWTPHHLSVHQLMELGFLGAPRKPCLSAWIVLCAENGGPHLVQEAGAPSLRVCTAPGSQGLLLTEPWGCWGQAGMLMGRSPVHRAR